MNARECRDNADEVTTHHLAKMNLQPGKAELWVMASTARAAWEIAAQLAEVNRHYEQGPELDLSLPAVEMMVARHLEIEAAPERVLYLQEAIGLLRHAGLIPHVPRKPS